jgi:integrase
VQYRLGWYRDKWAVIWTENGRTRRVSLGETDEQAAQVEFRDWVAKRKLIRPSGTITVGYILESYFKAKPTVVYRRHLVDWFRHHLPPSINQPLLDAYSDTRKGLSPSTVRSELAILNTALKWAVKMDLIDKAPYIPLPEGAPPREIWITRKDADKLVKAAGSFHIELFILIAKNTAARAGAILGLTWDQVRHGRIDFNEPGKARTRKKRAEVPVTPELAEALGVAKTGAVTPFVIEYARKPVRSIKKGFQRAAKRAGMPEVTPHVLRHSVATWLAGDGVPLAQIAAMLGNSEKMVERVYAKYTPGYLSKAMKSLGRGQMVQMRHNAPNKPGTAAKTRTKPAKKRIVLKGPH